MLARKSEIVGVDCRIDGTLELVSFGVIIYFIQTIDLKDSKFMAFILL